MITLHEIKNWFKYGKRVPWHEDTGWITGPVIMPKSKRR